MKNLAARALTGVVYVAVVIAGVVVSQETLMVLAYLFAGLGIYELGRLTVPSRDIFTMLVDITGGLVLVSGVFSAADIAYTTTCSLSAGYLLGAVYLLYMIARVIMQLYSEDDSPLKSLACSFMGQVYVALPVSLMGVIYHSQDGGRYLLLAMFIMIWLNDTGAYIVGSSIGKHRLFERISPKKSWEGFVGGALFAVASAFLLRFGFPGIWGNFPISFLCGLGAIVAVFGTWGDLVESLIKRSLGVKDSGNILPGHGGILDRIDSLLLVLPATTVYLFLWTIL